MKFDPNISPATLHTVTESRIIRFLTSKSPIRIGPRTPLGSDEQMNDITPGNVETAMLSGIAIGACDER